MWLMKADGWRDLVLMGRCVLLLGYVEMGGLA